MPIDGNMAFIPKCPLHIASPAALGELVSKMQGKGRFAQRDVFAQPQRPGYTYSGDPASSPTDNVRFMLGDTDIKTAYLSDSEIAYLLSENQDNALQAAFGGCDSIIAKLARNRDESVGSVSIAFSQQLAGFEKLSLILRRRFAKTGVPFAGGISRSQKQIERLNPDRVQPSFIRDENQYPDRPEDYSYQGLYSGSRSQAVSDLPYGTPYPLNGGKTGQ